MRRSSLPLGYEVFKLKGDSIYNLRRRLTSIVGVLEDYNPEDFTEKHVELAKQFHQMDEWKQVVVENKSFLKDVVGEKLLYQKTPYLRIARPNKPEDNIGIHRDTHYGASEDEWVLWAPLTNAIQGGELRILPGSHLKDYEYTQETNPQAPQGSDKHWLGFRYAPKRMGWEIEAKAIPIPCHVGQAIVFNCACVHGQTINTAKWTRFSTDIRLVDERGKFEPQRGLHGEIYARLP